MKVLVPVDGSDNSMRAVEFALNMAKGHTSMDVILLSVSCPFMERDFVDIAKLQESCRKEHSEYLDKARALFDEADLPVETVLVEGDPADAIIYHAKENAVGKIVMGSRGMGGLKSMVLGGVSYKVVGNVEVPVTIVK